MAEATFSPCAGITPSFTGHTLILPAVSCANVGQLCTDLLLFNATLKPTKVGHFRSRCILPVVGNDALGATTTNENPLGILSTAIQVFQLPEKQVTIVQLRAPVLKGRRQLLAEDLVKWSVSVGVAKIVVLAGADSSFWTEEQLVHKKIRFVSVSDSVEGGDSVELLRKLAENNVEELRKRPAVQVDFQDLVPDAAAKGVFPVARGGLLKPLVNAAENSRLQCLGLVLFCKEGDNIPEGMAMAELVNKLYGVVEVEGEEKAVRWRAPASWKVIM